ncbi:response regulator transcription factor [Pseudooceanicola atlanticus]|uniref:LuxR family transcriptional regulator n=1 Tax=Pseudooceanicola atlanticus TaxID=1461694 RepID=A0A0A0EJV1_9RHOB|nr:response regulator [Pseudooceanicola atlanticus]KGM50590.1 LuxR family transcriptional regulator [Pseudooceanicola atlanticus]
MTEQDRLVFVVDDDQDIRTSLTRALRQRGFEVEAFESAKAFLSGFDGSRSACLVLDYGMPDVNGLELQEELNSRGWPLAIVFITGHGGVRESVQAMKSGAVDFLEKPFRQSELVERIEVALDMAEAKRASTAEADEIRARFSRLTEREAEIVDQVLAKPAEASSKEIAAALGISPRTVDHHRARILEKLAVRSLVELVKLAAALPKDQKG